MSTPSTSSEHSNPTPVRARSGWATMNDDPTFVPRQRLQHPPVEGKPRPPLETEYAFRIVQHLSITSLKRWHIKTFQDRMPGVPLNEGDAPNVSTSWSMPEVIDWWRQFMLRLINEHRGRNDESYLDPDVYLFPPT